MNESESQVNPEETGKALAGKSNFSLKSHNSKRQHSQSGVNLKPRRAQDDQLESALVEKLFELIFTRSPKSPTSEYELGYRLANLKKLL